VTATERPGYTHVGRALDDAVDAERLGFRRVWLSERYDLKDVGALLGGIAARTTTLGVGTGALSVTSRNPVVTASLGSTMHGLYGPRFTLGLGGGVPMLDMPQAPIADVLAYARAIHGIWRGETVNYRAFGRPPVELNALDVLDDIPKPRSGTAPTAGRRRLRWWPTRCSTG
jgi:alkanesulfonate monooxygenase SsuD/methylene tetrahydromethanopterin reductase-like flavin-dependent oxidoreductase (luciferase family)